MASSYWKRRAERGMLYAQNQAEKRLVTIGKAMRDAQDYLTREAKSIFRTFANRFDLTEEQARAELARPITRAEYDRLVARMATLPQGAERTALEVRANSGAYAYRISRAEALRENIAIETARVSQVVEDELTGQLRMTATEGYARRMYDLQQQTGNAFAVPDLDALRVATDTPWSGVAYSQRIWNDREKLAGALEETITSGYLSGKSHAKVARAIQERFGVSFREAERLVRTETSHISNQADLAAYRDAGIEQYEFDAALDSRTCPVCGRMDGQVFDVAKAETGENLPPMHPHCRCTTVMADKTKGLQRRGRDADGKSVLLPGDMTYEEWKQWQQAGAPVDVRAWRGSLLRGGTGSGILNAMEANQALISNPNHGIIDMEIDELTPCLRKVSTGELVNTHVEPVGSDNTELSGWFFNWKAEASSSEFQVYALYADDDPAIQGLISVRPETGAWEVGYAEAAHYKKRPGKKYNGIAGHLFAEAVKQSKAGGIPDGGIYFTAKTKLIEYYKQELGAIQLFSGSDRMMLIEDASKALYERYYGRWE